MIPGPRPEIHTIGNALRSGSHRTDGKYKYLGGAVGVDGKVYFFPSDSDFVLQVDVSVFFACREKEGRARYVLTNGVFSA